MVRCYRDFLDLLKTTDKVTLAAVSEDPSGATFGIGQYLGYNRREDKKYQNEFLSVLPESNYNLFPLSITKHFIRIISGLITSADPLLAFPGPHH